MVTGITSWSQTAATNATADSTIVWSEGQAPSTINDSARAEMVILKKWHDDWSGTQPSNVVQTSSASATAQTLTTNISAASLLNGWTLTFKAGATNTGALTLAVDGLTAKAVQRISGTALIGGEIISGCVYTVTYHQPADAWVLRSAASDAIEGSWTPAYAFGGATTGITYTTQVGRYVRTGPLVTVWGTLVLSNNGTAVGAVTITGLPFAASTVSGLKYSGTIGHITGFVNNDSDTDQINISIASAASAIDFFSTAGPGESVAATTQSTDVAIADTAALSFSITYRAG